MSSAPAQATHLAGRPLALGLRQLRLSSLNSAPAPVICRLSLQPRALSETCQLRRRRLKLRLLGCRAELELRELPPPTARRDTESLSCEVVRPFWQLPAALGARGGNTEVRGSSHTVGHGFREATTMSAEPSSIGRNMKRHTGRGAEPPAAKQHFPAFRGRLDRHH